MADDLDLEAGLPSPSSALLSLLLLPPTPRDDGNDEDDIIGSSSSFPSSGNCSQSGRAAGRDGGPRSSRAMQKGSGRGGRFGEGKQQRNRQTLFFFRMAFSGFFFEDKITPLSGIDHNSYGFFFEFKGYSNFQPRPQYKKNARNGTRRMVVASYCETLRILRNINFNVPLYDTLSENYWRHQLYFT